jgi:hypothetical protein
MTSGFECFGQIARSVYILGPYFGSDNEKNSADLRVYRRRHSVRNDAAQFAESRQNRIRYGEIFGYSSMVLAFLMVFFGVRSYRDRVGGGKISFGRGLAVGLLITCVASSCYVATWQVVYHKIAPDFFDKYIDYVVAEAVNAGASEAQIAAKRKQMAEFGEMYKNPVVNIGVTFLEPLPVGVLFSFIAAGVLGRKRKLAETAT